ncbi:MAG: flagellar basal body-associated FliL family protein, partial [Bdellovibrionota bacterium]|nr:flagellar basal body-associated FliL family protein [Bdellovibrionota bacterium]
YKTIIFKRPLPNSEAEKAKLLASGQTFKPINSYKMKRVIVNLPSRSKKLRFLEITTEIVPFKDDQVAEIEKNKHIVRDTFLDIAGEMSPEELNSLTGKLLLESRIKNRLNKDMGSKIVQELYFTKFVVQ